MPGSLGLDNRYFSEDERRRAYRTASLRWHPDRFESSYGELLCDSEREAVLLRVTQVSQAVNTANDKSNTANDKSKPREAEEDV